MNAIAVGAALGLSAACALLLAFVVVARLVAGSARQRARLLRPELLREIAVYVADEHASPPARPRGRNARRVFRTVALDTLVELHGRERDRLRTLLERTGVVADTGRQLESRSTLVRLQAADVLGQIASAESSEMLLAGLSDREAKVRLRCARALAELGEERLLPAVLNTVEETVDQEAGSAAPVLIAIGTRRPAALGEIFASTHSSELRRLGASIIGALRLHECAPLLREALASSDEELVARAARGLGLIGDDEAVEALIELLEDERRPWFARAAAAKSLGAIGDTRAVGPLARQLRFENWWLQQKAAEALGLLGEPGERALRLALDSWWHDTRSHAGVALES